MKIKVESSNIDEIHPSVTGWINSRPNNDPIPQTQIMSLDLPVNEIPMATLFIESTILEREIIVSLRNHVMWAQTSRVQDVTKFTYPAVFEISQEAEIEACRAKMIIEKAEGKRQDHYRRHLPLMSNTKYTVNFSMRDLIHLALFFEELRDDDKYLHLSMLFAKSVREIKRILYVNFRFDFALAGSYKKRPIMRSINNYQSGVVGDVLVVNTSLSLSLRAQLARHRALVIQDNLLDLMANKSIITANNEMKVEVQVSGLIEDWTEIVRKRSCWIAQYDLWKGLLNKAEHFLNLGVSGLPCHSGKCPFHGDAKARYTNEDPNAPCPIHADLTQTKINRFQIKEMRDQFDSDKRPKFWSDLITKLEIKK